MKHAIRVSVGYFYHVNSVDTTKQVMLNYPCLDLSFGGGHVILKYVYGSHFDVVLTYHGMFILRRIAAYLFRIQLWCLHLVTNYLYVALMVPLSV